MVDDRPLVVAHHQATLMKTREPEMLDVLLRRPEVRGLIWTTLRPGLAAVDPERLSLLRNRLRELGYATTFHGPHALLVDTETTSSREKP